MTISKISWAVSPLEETEKINEVIDGVNAAVHLTGDETIGGAKTFMVNIAKQSVIPYATAPSGMVWDSVDFKGSDNKYGGRLVRSLNAEGTAALSLFVNNPIYDGDNINWTGLGIQRNSDGTTFAFAPASAENGSIVTTVNKVRATNGYFQLGNGMIVQWGFDRMPANATSATVTLPKAFTTTNYTALAQHQGDGVSTSQSTVSTRSTTGFHVHYLSSYTSDRYFLWIAIGY